MTRKKTPPGTHLSFRLEPESAKLVDEPAKLSGVSVGQYARSVLVDHLARTGVETPPPQEAAEAIKHHLKLEFDEMAKFLVERMEDLVTERTVAQTKALDQGLRTLHANVVRIMQFLSEAAPERVNGDRPRQQN